MTRDDIIRMAREGKSIVEQVHAYVSFNEIEYKSEHMAKMVRDFIAAERDEIMLLCHEIENDFKEELGITGDPNFYERMLGVVECIDEIRARGNND